MGQLLLFIVVAVVVAAIVFGVTVMLGGGDSGLTPVEADGRAIPLPSDRPLGEDDIDHTKFDVAWRGYRMAQVDQALQRAAYDIGYKGELIGVLEAEVTALREGRLADADVLRRAREAAIAPAAVPPADGAASDAADEAVVEGAVVEITVTPAYPSAADPAPVDPAEVEPAPAEAVAEKPADEPAVEVPGDDPVEESEAAERR
jgi:DivIVA domain-containing protein